MIRRICVTLALSAVSFGGIAAVTGLPANVAACGFQGQTSAHPDRGALRGAQAVGKC